jgi:hypothetical protein
MNSMLRLSPLLVFLGGCGGANVWGPGGEGGGGGTVVQDGREGTIVDDDFCPAGGPLVDVPDMGGEIEVDRCTGEVAERVFGHAICSCADTNVAGYLTTRSFDSDVDPEALSESGGPVGVNGQYLTGGYADVGGTFVVAGAQSLTFAGYVRAGGDLEVGGDVTAAGYINVLRDAWFAGDVLVPGYTEVARDLYQPPGKSMLTVLDVGGERHDQSFAVEPPCPCGPADVIDIGAMVEAARLDNDNAAVGLDPGALANVVGIGVEIELPCGRFYLDSVGGLGGITLRMDGHTALFVGGDVDAVGALDVELGPEGELDLFIAGNLVTIGAGSFGDRSRPSATRVYIGGAGDVVLVGASEFVGNVYAPRSRITSVGAAFVYGSIFGQTIDIPGALIVSYDLDILEVGEDCGQPDAEPGDCDRCDSSCPGNRACVDGACVDCRTDADCCEPLVCWPDGTCGPLMF